MHSMTKYNSTFKLLVDYINSLGHKPGTYTILRHHELEEFHLYNKGDFMECIPIDGFYSSVTLQAIKRFMFKHRQIN